MKPHKSESVLDDLFHGCALRAFVEQANLQKAWPDRETTRRNAFRLYEEEIAARHRRHSEIDEPGSEPLPCVEAIEKPYG